MKLIAVVALFIVLMGCGSLGLQFPLEPVRYDSTSDVKSDSSIEIILETGDVDGTGRGEIYLQSLKFGEEDQNIFVQSLASELVRLGMFPSNKVNSTSNSDFKITLNFADTYHYQKNQQYLLNVVMSIDDGETENKYYYEIDSADGDTAKQKRNTSAVQGKKKAGMKLISEVVKDIEQWIGSE